jgi:hypothetical protein
MSDIIGTIVGAIVGAIAGGTITSLIERRKEKRENSKEAKKQQREAVQNRPEMQITDYKDYVSRIGYGVKQKCDVNLIVAPIDSVTIEGKKRKEIVNAHYKSEYFNENEWCCVIYTLKNAGHTDISVTDIIWNSQKTACIFPLAVARRWAEGKVLNYSCCHDQKVRIGESVTVKICYHKEVVPYGLVSAPFSIGMIDDNGRYWIQPLFAPHNKIYDSRSISPQEYNEKIRTECAEACFKTPSLW